MLTYATAIASPGHQQQQQQQREVAAFQLSAGLTALGGSPRRPLQLLPAAIARDRGLVFDGVEGLEGGLGLYSEKGFYSEKCGGGTVLASIVIGNLFNGIGNIPAAAATQEGEAREVEARSWTSFVKEEGGHSLARIIKKVSFELAPRLPVSGGAGNEALERSIERRHVIDITAEPFEITRWSLAPYSIIIDMTLFDGTSFKVSHYLCLYNSGSWSDRKESTPDDTFPITKYLLCLV